MPDPHWTETSVDAFFQRIVFDFITQIDKRLESLSLNQGDLAARLCVSEGRVSQILNNPGNVISLKKAIKLARAVGMKVALVSYFDDDSSNEFGPINSDIFRLCWEKANKPRTFRNLQPVAEIDNAVTGEVTLTELKPNLFRVSRNAYSTRSSLNSHYANVVGGRIARAVPAEGLVPSLIWKENQRVALPNYYQGGQ